MTDTVQLVAPHIPSAFAEAKSCRPLEQEEAKFLFHMGLAEADSILHTPTKGFELENTFRQLYDGNVPVALNIIMKRLQAITPDVLYVPCVVIFLASMCDRPGTAVIAAYSIFRETQERGKTVTLQILCDEIMPFGYPVEEELHAYWDRQKGKTKGEPDNWLDSPLVWK